MRQDSAAEGGAILSRCVMGRVRGYCNNADYARPKGLAFFPPCSRSESELSVGGGKKNARPFGRAIFPFLNILL